MAIVNGRVIEEGGSFGSWRVVSVTDRAVVLENGAERITLDVNP
jgi:hypothetical protein